jgi:hypothetical protein
VPYLPSTTRTDLVEANARADTAHNLITGFSLAVPALDDLWRQIQDSLADIPVLASEITHLDDTLARARLDRANLAAAAKVTVAAYGNGDPDPLSYLRDELAAQGFSTGRGLV